MRGLAEQVDESGDREDGAAPAGRSRLTPISIPHALAIRATSSQDPAGAASGSDNWQPGPRPGLHPARQVDHVAALAGQERGCPRGPVA